MGFNSGFKGLTTVLDGDKRSASLSGHLIPGEGALGACWIGGLLGTKVGLGTF